MNISNGQQRVIITNISPLIDDGKYPAKRVIDELITLSADIFTDGHDEIAASVLVKHEADKLWREVPMNFMVNDHWEVGIQATKTGFYQFQLMAWIDHFSTWKKGLVKKKAAGQDIAVELQIGAELLQAAIETAKPALKKQLKSWISQLQPDQDVNAAVALATSEEVSDVMRLSRVADLITKHPTIMVLEVERKKAGFSTWYELFPRSAASEPGFHGTFNDVKNLLPRIAGMGFDVLYFPPIHPIGVLNRKGKNNSLTPAADDPGSPWAIGSELGGHKAIHPQLGTVKDFKALIAEANKFDIELAMDIAYQCAPDHPYVKSHPQWFKWRPDGTVQYAENPPKKYEDILPFNFETDDWQNLWQELKSVVDYWITLGVRIFRIDNPHTKSFAFWEWMIREIRTKNPEVIFLAEAFTRPRLMEQLAKIGFNQSYTYFTWRNTKQELEEYITELTQTNLQYYFRPNFWPNTPDILPHHLVEGRENAHNIRLILAATLSSNYGLYGPVYEFGINTPFPGKEEYNDNEKYEIKHWDWNRYSHTGEIISRINKIRKANPALQTTWNILLAETSNDQVICYAKANLDRSNRLIIAVNLDPFHTQGAYVNIPIKELGIKPDQHYTVTDLLSGAKYHWVGEVNYVALNPYEMPAHILKIELAQ
ncbi:MAG: alpha-1,4-glucan--maltose-1-phosphate maltosyltransferase [Sphingobacteriaceae bacterium]